MTDYSQLRHLGLFDARVPRYTSYPTAPQFSDQVGPAETTAWLQSIPANSSISLYVHVPFCRRLCWFCACRTQGTATAEPVEAYVDTVLAEIDLVVANLSPGVKLSRLHWGGGTPTLMTAQQITRLAGSIRARLPFADDHEFSVEIDPNEVDDARLDALAAAGMNRASIGVQDFDPLIQKAIGRDQSYEVTAAAVHAIRERGVRSLNMDILFGLPHQTLARIRDGVGKVLSLSPDRVALYGYAHVPWMARRQGLIPAEALPDPLQRLALFEAAEHLFLQAGYQAIGIDHFAKPDDTMAEAARSGMLRRNFQGYTVDPATALIGIGASSISRYPQGYAQNAAATSAYQGAIREGRLATTRGHQFRGDDLLRGRVIEALMCDFAADLGAIAAEQSTDKARALALCEGLTEKFPGMTRLEGDRLAILDQGRPLTRMIARHFDAYAVREAGHSPAI
jgi:oxygen-independent coproporphyrinogen-3 oxidase